VKLLPEMYFTDMFAGKSSKMHRKWFRKFHHTWIAFGTAQNGNTSAANNNGPINSEIVAGNVIGK